MVNGVAHKAIKRTTVASGTELRILPLGDSITWGTYSTDGNGYRLDLQNDLSGSNLLYVGSQQGGSMADNFNEGHHGATINQIAGYADASLPERPNIVLVHAGTNDLASGSPTDPYNTAPDRLGALIDKVVAACPDAAVLVAQIVHAGDADADARIQTFNDAVPGVVAQRANAGKHVMVVDMRSVTASDLQPGPHALHPSDEGYNKMASIWFTALQAADANGWIRAPVGPDPSTGAAGKQQCGSAPFWYAANGDKQLASGIGTGGNGILNSNWLPQGQIFSGIELNGTGVRFADINGDGERPISSS